MKKRILSFISAVIVFLAVVFPVCVSAITPLDPNAEASLTLHYQKDDKAFPDLSVAIYRVAEAFPDGSFDLIQPFAAYPVNIYGITVREQWNIVAQTLSSYIVADRITPDREETTDNNGTASFTGLKTGLYLVREVVAENDDGTYVFNQFMVYLPTPQPNGTYNYDVVARPKCTGFVPKDQYTVTVLWQDEGFRNVRPKEVIVDIYKDGALQDSQIMSADNNWFYLWKVSGENYGVWTVNQRTTPAGYTVSSWRTGNNFFILNSRQPVPDIPQTGDSFTPLPWILVMCISGIVLLILGIYSRRRK